MRLPWGFCLGRGICLNGDLGGFLGLGGWGKRQRRTATSSDPRRDREGHGGTGRRAGGRGFCLNGDLGGLRGLGGWRKRQRRTAESFDPRRDAEGDGGAQGNCGERRRTAGEGRVIHGEAGRKVGAAGQPFMEGGAGMRARSAKASSTAASASGWMPLNWRISDSRAGWAGRLRCWERS